MSRMGRKTPIASVLISKDRRGILGSEWILRGTLGEISISMHASARLRA